MIRENNEKYGGINPYTPPDFTIDENRFIKYDDVGDIKSISIKQPTETEKIKLDFKRVKKYVIAFLVFCVLMECYYFATTFRTWKWQVKAWRPLIVNNLQNGSTLDFAEKAYSEKIQTDVQLGIDVLTEPYHLGKRSQLRKLARKNDVLFMTKDEIHDVFGEPSSEEIEDVFSEFTSENVCFSHEYYLAYSNRYLVVDYCADICIGVRIVTNENES